MSIIKKLNKKQKIVLIIGIILISILFCLKVFAESSVEPDLIEEGGKEYIYFELDHNLTNAKYKYFGYGYHVAVQTKGGEWIGYKFISNAEFGSRFEGSKEIVKIPTEKVFDILEIPDEYYYQKDNTIWLNGRLGIKVNGNLTHVYDSLDGQPEKGLKHLGLDTGYTNTDGIKKSNGIIPLNKDNKGIRNGLQHEYGVSWSWITANQNLPQHFGIDLHIDPIMKFDGYEVQYRDLITGGVLPFTDKPLQNFGETRTITEYPESINGYEYSGYYRITKADPDGNTFAVVPSNDKKGSVQGECAKVDLLQKAERYTITFFYNKYTAPSEGGGEMVTVEIYYKDSLYGKDLAPMKEIQTNMFKNLNISSLKIDKYECKGYYIDVGTKIEYFYRTNVNLFLKPNIYEGHFEGVE